MQVCVGHLIRGCLHGSAHCKTRPTGPWLAALSTPVRHHLRVLEIDGTSSRMCDAPAIKACSLGSFRRILDSAVAQSSLRPRWVWKPLSLFQSPQRSGCESCWQALCAPTADCGGHFVDWFWYQGLAQSTRIHVMNYYMFYTVRRAERDTRVYNGRCVLDRSRISDSRSLFYGRRHSLGYTDPTSSKR